MMSLASGPLHTQLFVLGCAVLSLALLAFVPSAALSRLGRRQPVVGLGHGCAMTLLLATVLPIALLGVLLVMASYSSNFGR